VTPRRRPESSFGGPGDSPGFLLWRTTLRWQHHLAEALRPCGLTHVQFVLLATVWWLTAPGAEDPSQRQVADHAGIDVMMTSQVLRSLEARGLVTRRADPADSRVKRLTVTPRGAALAQKAVDIVEAADREFFADVRDPARLLSILRKLGNWQPSPGGPNS